MLVEVEKKLNKILFQVSHPDTSRVLPANRNQPQKNNLGPLTPTPSTPKLFHDSKDSSLLSPDRRC